MSALFARGRQAVEESALTLFDATKHPRVRGGKFGDTPGHGMKVHVTPRPGRQGEFEKGDRVKLADGREGTILQKTRGGAVKNSFRSQDEFMEPEYQVATRDPETDAFKSESGVKHSSLSYHPEEMAARHERGNELLLKADKVGPSKPKEPSVVSRPVTLNARTVPADWQVEHGYAEFVQNSMHKNPAEGQQVKVWKGAPEHGGKTGTVVQARSPEVYPGTVRGGTDAPGTPVNPLIQFEGEKEPKAVKQQWLYDAAQPTVPVRLKPGTDVERMIFHHMAGRPAPPNPAPGSAKFEQFTYGMQGKGFTKRPGNKADRASVIAKLTAAAVARGLGDEVGAQRSLLEAELLLTGMPVVGISEGEIELLEAEQLGESALPFLHVGRSVPRHTMHFGEFDPTKHPRGRQGQFAETLGRLGRDHEATLPHGVSVKKSILGGFKIQGPEGTASKHSFDPEVASKLAHEMSSNEGRRTGRSHVIEPGRYDAMHRPGYGGTDVDAPAPAWARGMGPSAREQITGKPSPGEKIQAMIDSGLADDEDDARAQLSAMGGMQSGSRGDRVSVKVNGQTFSGAPEILHPGPEFTQHDEMLRQGKEAWRSNEAYLDNAGNYRLKGTRKVAPWSKAVKSEYPNNDDFHQAAHPEKDFSKYNSIVHNAAFEGITPVEVAARAAAGRASVVTLSPAERRTNDRLAQLRGIVGGHQHAEIEGHPVDVQTANLLLKVHDSLSPENKKKFGTVPIHKLADFAWKRVR